LQLLNSLAIAQFSCDRSVLWRTLPTAAPPAPASAARPDLSRHELAVGFFPHGKDAVADFEIFQRDGLTLFGERGLVIDYDDSFALAATHFDLIPVNGKDFAARAVARHRPATAGASAPWTKATTSAGTPASAARAHASTAWPATTLEPLKLFLCDAIDPHGHHLLVSVRSATHHDVVTDFQIFQLEFMRLLLPLLPLAETCLIVYQHGLGSPIGRLDLEAINSHGRDGSHHRRATHPSPTRFLSRSWRILLCCQKTGNA
jgi:hypothetical protein